MQKVSSIAWRLCRGAFRRLLIFIFAILLTLLASLILGLGLIAAQFGRPFSLCLGRPFSLCLVWLIFVNVYNFLRCLVGSTFLGPRRIAAAWSLGFVHSAFLASGSFDLQRDFQVLLTILF